MKKLKQPLKFPDWKDYTMIVEERRLIEEKAAFECDCCGKQIKRAGKFEYRHPQYVVGHIPKLMSPICRNCVYYLTYGRKGVMKYKKANTIEKESSNYDNIN